MKTEEQKKEAERKRLEHDLRYISYGTVITNFSGGRRDVMLKPINWVALYESSKRRARKERRRILNFLLFKYSKK